jgi:hypothetical protein
VPEATLNGVLTGLTDVLKALKTNEAVFVRQLRQLRSQPRSDISSASSPIPVAQSRPFEPLRRTARTDDTAIRGHDLPRPTQMARAAPTKWPTDPDEDSVVSTNEKRDYNYFLELDEKLARLQQMSSGRRSI